MASRALVVALNFFCKKLLENWLWSAAIFVGTRGRPGRLNDHERHGTGDKNTNFPLGSFHRENETTFSGIPFITENFQRNEPKGYISFTSQAEFLEFFGKWKRCPRTGHLASTRITMQGICRKKEKSTKLQGRVVQSPIKLTRIKEKFDLIFVNVLVRFSV